MGGIIPHTPHPSSTFQSSLCTCTPHPPCEQLLAAVVVLAGRLAKVSPGSHWWCWCSWAWELCRPMSSPGKGGGGWSAPGGRCRSWGVYLACTLLHGLPGISWRTPCVVLLFDSHPIIHPMNRGLQQWERVAWMVYSVPFRS